MHPPLISRTASARKKHCGGAKVIWRKRRGLRTRGVGPGGERGGTPCISPSGGTAYMALVQDRDCRPGKSGCCTLIRRIEPSGKRQPIEQSVKSRITTWKSESFFRTAGSNTLTSSAILF